MSLLIWFGTYSGYKLNTHKFQIKTSKLWVLPADTKPVDHGSTWGSRPAKGFTLRSRQEQWNGCHTILIFYFLTIWSTHVTQSGSTNSYSSRSSGLGLEAITLTVTFILWVSKLSNTLENCSAGYPSRSISVTLHLQIASFDQQQSQTQRIFIYHFKSQRKSTSLHVRSWTSFSIHKSMERLFVVALIPPF